MKLGIMFSISVSGLGIRKASEVAVPVPVFSVCYFHWGGSNVASNTIFGENNPFVESANQRWLAKKNGFYRYRKQDKAEKERARLFSAEKNIQIGCSVHQLDYYRPHVLIV